VLKSQRDLLLLVINPQNLKMTQVMAKPHMEKIHRMLAEVHLLGTNLAVHKDLQVFLRITILLDPTILTHIHPQTRSIQVLLPIIHLQVVLRVIPILHNGIDVMIMTTIKITIPGMRRATAPFPVMIKATILGMRRATAPIPVPIMTITHHEDLAQRVHTIKDIMHLHPDRRETHTLKILIFIRMKWWM
jgi:hypothetical protein